MGGENIGASTQPGGRPAAPGSLALAQAFLNTHFDLEVAFGADLLATPAGVRAWFSGQDLMSPADEVSAAQHDLILGAREALRALAALNGADAGERRSELLAILDDAARGAPVEVRLGPGRPHYVPAHGGGARGALGVILAIVAQAIENGRWSRLKVCPGEECGWAFYDQSRNQAGRWCSMSVCGGRAKARTHYRRQRGQ